MVPHATSIKQNYFKLPYLFLDSLFGVLRSPPQCTFWRFLASLHGSVSGQLLEVQQCMRQRVWEAANVRFSAVVLDTDTTVHTLFGDQMGARKGYNPKNKGNLRVPDSRPSSLLRLLRFGNLQGEF